MLSVHQGQCGLCVHFGEDHGNDQKLIQIRTTKQADEKIVEECGLPKNRQVHLMVTPISGCEGFEPAAQVQ